MSRSTSSDAAMAVTAAALASESIGAVWASSPRTPADSTTPATRSPIDVFERTRILRGILSPKGASGNFHGVPRRVRGEIAASEPDPESALVAAVRRDAHDQQLRTLGDLDRRGGRARAGHDDSFLV